MAKGRAHGTKEPVWASLPAHGRRGTTAKRGGKGSALEESPRRVKTDYLRR